MQKLNLKEYSTIFAGGGACYTLLELAWRGRSHFTMTLTGGLCSCLIYGINKRLKNRRSALKCFMGASAITAVEFMVGCIVNRMFELEVWDYSDQPGNIMGQICPLYSALWMGLCAPLVPVCGWLEKKLCK